MAMMGLWVKNVLNTQLFHENYSMQRSMVGVNYVQILPKAEQNAPRLIESL